MLALLLPLHAAAFGLTPHFGLIVIVQSESIVIIPAKFATGSCSGG